jgi:hypothetical protein
MRRIKNVCECQKSTDEYLIMTNVKFLYARGTAAISRHPFSSLSLLHHTYIKLCPPRRVFADISILIFSSHIARFPFCVPSSSRASHRPGVAFPRKFTFGTRAVPRILCLVSKIFEKDKQQFHIQD